MLLTGDRKSSRRVVWKDNALGIRPRWHNEAHRKRINGRSRRWRRVWVSRRKFPREDQEETGNAFKDTYSNFVFILFWIPDLQIYLLARHVQRTFDEDKHENQMFSLSLVYWFFFTIFVAIPSKQQTKFVMTLSVCKNVRILIFRATGSAANVLRALGSTVK